MILRRIITHLRKQEWIAVGIDLVIVVLGVFLGLEASNWNTDRENKRLENEYLMRLHEELVDITEREGALAAGLEESSDQLAEVTAYLVNGDADFEASADQCFAVFRANIYSGAVTVPPTIGELISTGRIVLVRNDDLRASLLRLAQSADQFSQLRTDLQSGRISLSQRYPALLRLRPDDIKGIECEFAAMARTPGFLNDFSDSVFRYQAHQGIMEQQQELRVSLHAALDQELGLNHPPSAQAD